MYRHLSVVAQPALASFATRRRSGSLESSRFPRIQPQQRHHTSSSLVAAPRDRRLPLSSVKNSRATTRPNELSTGSQIIPELFGAPHASVFLFYFFVYFVLFFRSRRPTFSVSWFHLQLPVLNSPINSSVDRYFWLRPDFEF